MWIESSTAMGMMKIGIIELMMWIVWPVTTSSERHREPDRSVRFPRRGKPGAAGIIRRWRDQR